MDRQPGASLIARVPFRVGLRTIGCRANAADTQALAELLETAGVPLARGAQEAAVYVVHTCTVTHRADADARKLVRGLHRRHPSAKVVLVGCLAQVSPDSLRDLPGVAAVVGATARAELPALLAELAAAGGMPGLCFPEGSPVALRPASAIRSLPRDRARPLLKIQDGCDRACAYCIVPRARGPGRSLAPAEVLAAARRYAALGAEEIVLSGVHLGAYGRDAGAPFGLAELLAGLDEELARFARRETPRIRLSSLEPDEVDQPLLDLLRRPRFCGHLHLPLQSGDDAVLRAMRRPYGAEDFRRTVERARRALPDAALGADVIVGFPGESRASFERTLAFVEGLDLSYLHVFSYSERPGTPAASFPYPVDPRERRDRSRRLRALGEAKRAAFHRRQEGRRARVLVETPWRADGGLQRGDTGNYVPVVLDGLAWEVGRLVSVTLGALRSGRVSALPVSAQGAGLRS